TRPPRASKDRRKTSAIPLLYSLAMSNNTAAVWAPRLLRAKAATTSPWKSSMNAARNTYCLPAVVVGFVDQGEIMGVRKFSAICAAGTALRLALGPMTAITWFWVISLVVAATALAASSLLSSTMRRMV